MNILRPGKDPNSRWGRSADGITGTDLLGGRCDSPCRVSAPFSLPIEPWRSVWRRCFLWVHGPAARFDAREHG